MQESPIGSGYPGFVYRGWGIGGCGDGGGGEGGGYILLVFSVCCLNRVDLT